MVDIIDTNSILHCIITEARALIDKALNGICKSIINNKLALKILC